MHPCQSASHFEEVVMVSAPSLLSVALFFKRLSPMIKPCLNAGKKMRDEIVSPIPSRGGGGDFLNGRGENLWKEKGHGL